MGLYITLILSKPEYASVVWNNLTLADSNKLENIKEGSQIYVIIDLFSPGFFFFFCNYESILNHLHFKTRYFGRENLDALFLINVSKNKTDCCSIMDTVGLRVPTKPIRDTCTFNVSNASRQPFNKVRYSFKQHLRIPECLQQI
jgi:hypothetical protein